VIITLPVLLAGMQIGGGLASKLIEKTGNKKLARNIQTLIGGFTAGAQGMSTLAGAFGSPSTGTGLKIGKGTEGVGPLADPKDYIGGLTGSIADKTQQNFSSGFGLNWKGDYTVDPKKEVASLFDYTSYV